MNSRLALRSILASAFVLGGCSAIIGINDVSYDPSATQGSDVDGSTNPDGGPTTLDDGATVLPDGAVVTDGSTEPDGAACAGADLMTDAKHCGRCGHDCLGGACSAGKCQAVQLGSAGSSPLTFVAVSDNDVFATGDVELTSQVGGVWRTPKAPGAGITSFVADATMRYAYGIAVIDQKLYMTNADYKASGGGLYACDLLGPANCTPSKIVDAELPFAVSSVGGKLYFWDHDKGIMVYTPGGTVATFRANLPGPRLYADGKNAYYIITFDSGGNRYAALLEALPNGNVKEMSRYETPTVDRSDIAGNATDLFFTAWDSEGSGGGIARRIPRTDGQPSCEYGGATNARPQGITVDAENVYWTNGGTGPKDGPWTNGSLNTCKLSGCCTTPDVLWTGNGRPFGVTTDDKAIYWVTQQTGQIWKIAKP
ncbi:hypothetical protein AKJ09_02670 [Labilithrix luteola]|uniref:Tryptophan synthase alpha chain n=1 Tax=Labilithrix luteola TaxID=1391654 RepID=A0A0K1PRK1_9BACT|nr:hypothetical protein [Labilithrix luteola]AKU96006.1 hypothetical protein AKJ09_02670 [Labilithrix luteola]